MIVACCAVAIVCAIDIVSYFRNRHGPRGARETTRLACSALAIAVCALIVASRLLAAGG